jgi:outer membrane protein assembly factor BamB
LRVAADDATVRARATELLAQLMIKNRQMEDAVGLFLQLGKEYPTVVIRDGKTGADFLTSLLTDKRLLPFLEPSRYPLPTRMKAEQLGAQNNNFGVQFEVESPPDLFPMFRQYRFALDMYRSGNGSWSLIGYDRATGAEKCRFPNMMAPNLYTTNGQPISYSKFVQGTGHVMLVQLGMWVYCFDLVEKKELWNRNLLGENPPPFQPGNPNPPVEVGPDGECTIRYPDGYTITLGHATVVQPGFVALLTRDGLECVEPQSRRVQWVRKGIPDNTQIHGDARHVVLIETEPYDPNQPNKVRKPVATKLIRAVDGMVVENSPDSARVLAAARSFKVYGRHALLADGTGDQPRTVRFYDLATGKDVWKREYDPKSIPIGSPLHAEWTGVLKSDGTAEILAVKTGDVVAKLALDPKHVEEQMKPCGGAQLLADADRFYLILDRDAAAGSTNGTRPVPMYNNNMLRSLKVNGPIYAFDRATGKRLWTYADVLENQWLVLEQFADMPVFIAAAPVMRENNQYAHAVVVIEKERGRLLLDKSVVYNGNFFQSLTVDQKNGTISLNRFDTRISITPDEPRGGK